MLIEPAIHHGPADVVIVVAEMIERLGHDVQLGTQQLVKLLELGQPFRRDLLGPVVGAGHAERLGGEQAGELDVAGIDAKQGGILASAASLHAGRDHHGRKGDGRPRINAAQNEGLRTTAAGAGDADPCRINIRQCDEPIERPDRVVRLQPHDALQMQLGLRAEEAPVFARFHLRTAAAIAMRELERNLLAVGVAHHVVRKDHATHPPSWTHNDCNGLRPPSSKRSAPSTICLRTTPTPASWKRPFCQWPCGNNTPGHLPVASFGR